MRKFIVLSVAVAGLLASACNTIEGAGKDVKAAGAAVEETAKDAN
ncbi:MAG: entericidin A/B family lipoprotein [Caulobacter sp.]|nr:entericidin A/B family lipoprotein [Caulobacter sp.]